MDNRTERVLAMPDFQRLLKKRQKTRFVLAAISLLCFVFFVGGIAFYSDFFALPLYEGATLTIGIAVTVLVIVAFLALEFLYVRISEKTLGPLQESVIDQLESAGDKGERNE